MRKLRGRKLKRQKQLVILSLIVLMVFFTTGYAAFSTKIKLNAKGNIKSYKLTLDPNGGILDVTSKRVTKGKTYGELPTPTREGYIFKGWNGKNLFNSQDFYTNGKDYSVHIDGDDILLNTYPYQENVTKLPINFKDNTQYTLSYNWIVEEITAGERIQSGLAFWYSDETCGNAISRFSGQLNDSGSKTITSDINKKATYVSSAGWSWSGRVRLSNIQLEEGTEATDYEPYFITSDTIVTQEGAHTLTAIWEEEPVEQTEP